jgi:PelA/Pel-15E family pectate lyase
MNFIVRSFIVMFCVAAPAMAATVMDLRNKPDEWHTSDEGKRTIDNVISAQRTEGGWKKAYDVSKPDTDADKRAGGSWDAATIDNGATYTEIRLLAKHYTLTKRPAALESFNRGVDFLIANQYANGGWPQRFPPPAKNYGRYVTFNDDAMMNVLQLLGDIAAARPPFEFVDAERRMRVKQSFDRGITCVLRAQIVVDGKPTGWAQQYDEKTLAPAMARSYELPAISGSETAGVAMLLMRLENPTPEQRRAIEAAVAWTEKSKITGKRLEKRDNDIVLVDDPAAPPLWARFYEIETNKPFFCGRDGVKKYSIAELDRERRVGYAWLRPWGQKVLDEYPKWRATHGGGNGGGRPTAAGGEG